jgi:chromosome partitioning protein
MSIVIAFVSQKGGVGKSTLARALAASATRAELKVKLADLDPQQRTLVLWEQTRKAHKVRPTVNVAAFTNAMQALKSVKSENLLILDTPGQLADALVPVAPRVHLFVQPTSPSPDDLHISVLVFQALERIGIPRERLAFALCRVLSAQEEKEGRSYLAGFGYTVLAGAVPEHLTYREAMKAGHSIIETRQKALNTRAEELMADLLRRAAANVEKAGKGATLPIT